jgi:hypothetical protein
MGLHNLSEVGTRRACLTRLDGENCTYALNFGIQVQSNLTVSVGSVFSFDGAGICVQPGN